MRTYPIRDGEPHCPTCTCYSTNADVPEMYYCKECGVSLGSKLEIDNRICDPCDELRYRCDICGDHLGEPRDDDRICDTCAALSRLRSGK